MVVLAVSGWFAGFCLLLSWLVMILCVWCGLELCLGVVGCLLDGLFINSVVDAVTCSLLLVG